MNVLKKQFGKLPFLGFLLLLLISGPQRAQAQWFTTDLPHIAVQSAEFVKKANDWVHTLEAYKTAASLYETTMEAKKVADNVLITGQKVRDLTNDALNLSTQVQNDMKRVQSQFSNLKLSSFGDVLSSAQNLAGAHGGLDYAPSIRGTGSFFNSLAAFGGGSAEQARSDRDRLAGIFNPYNKVGNQTPDELRASSSETAVSLYALEQQHQKQLIQQAGDYRRMADELTAKSEDTARQLTQDSEMKFTEGERAKVLTDAGAQLIEASRLRQQAADMLAQAAVKGPATRAAEGLYQDAVYAGTYSTMLNTFQD